MKIRMGFVSNSSTSSFVLLGFDVSNAVTERAEIRKLVDRELWKENYAVLFGEESGVRSGQTVVGKFLLSISSDDYMESEEFDLDAAMTKLQSTIADVSKLRERLGANTPISIYAGTRMS